MQGQEDEDSLHADWKPRHNPWLVCMSVMLPTIMEVLDTTITNVALPHIAGNMAVSTHEATWVLTSYLVANAIILPAAAWFSGFFGRKNFLNICIILFTIASLMCGIAKSLGFLLFARACQGFGGGALMPISQSVLLESFPKEKRGMAMAVFAIGVIVAPIVGPVVGGWLTDNFSWRWVFFINLPVGIAAIFFTGLFVEDPPYIKRKSAMIDYVGFALMAIGLGLLQVVLDKGQEVDWFATAWLVRASIIVVVSLIAFVLWELRVEHPIVNFRILKDSNFSAGLVAAMMIGVTMYGIATILPLFYQTLMGYPAYLSGLTSAPLGIGAFVASIVVGVLSARFDGRIFFCAGLATLAIGAFWLSDLNMQIAMQTKILPIIVIGAGLSMSFVPLATLTVGHLENKDMGNASGLFNLMRNIGGSIGIAMTTTMLARMSQVHQNFMVGHVTPYDPMYQQAVQAVGQTTANGLIYQTLMQQSTLLAYIYTLRWFGALGVICILLAIFFKRIEHKSGEVMMH